MGEVSAAEFYRVIAEQTRELNKHVDTRYQQMVNALAVHEIEDRRIANLVLQIQTQREDEKAQAIKNAVWVSMVVSGGLGAFFKWILK
jgi:hypothetical protein